MDLADSIKKLLEDVWKLIQKTIVQVFNFFKNIVTWFSQPSRLEKIMRYPEIIAVAIKMNLENGDFNVANVLYDKAKDELVNPKDDAIIVTASDLDSETLSKFGNKDMLILESK